MKPFRLAINRAGPVIRDAWNAFGKQNGGSGYINKKGYNPVFLVQRSVRCLIDALAF